MARAGTPPQPFQGGRTLDDLPLFPLHAVLFPGGRLPLRIFEQRYMEMAKGCLRDGAPFGVCLILEGKEVGEPAVPAEVGCLARLSSWDMPQLGVLQVVALGKQRFRVLSQRAQPDGLLRACVALLDEPDSDVPPQLGCVRLMERILEEHPTLFERPWRLDSAAWLTGRLAEVLPLPLALKQELLECDADARLARLTALLRSIPSAPA